MGKYVEVDRTIETALLLLEEGEDEQTLAYNAALVAFIKNMENVPTADVEEVVRCKDCQYAKPHNDDFWIKNNAPLLCEKYDWYVENDGYCSEGELKDG